MSDIVERLRSKTTSLTMLNKQESLELADEIEELQACLEESRAIYDEQTDRITRQKQRIKELEKQNAQLRYEVGGDISGYIITDEQIDAAWEEANKTTGTQYENVTLLRFLKKHFGIERCEGCGGSGVVEQEVCIGEHFVTHEMAMDAGMPETEGSHYGYEYGSETAPCPDCGGHRWVRPEKP